MKILVTGGLGGIGKAVVAEGLARGHSMTIFDLDTGRNRKAARKYGPAAGLRFGDIRDREAVAAAAKGMDAVIHMAAILPPASEGNPGLCEAVNVGGTRNLLEALRSAGGPGRVVHVSSVSVMGPTQGKPPPVRPEDPLVASDAYSRTKIAAEALVGASGLDYCILRLAAVLPTRLDIPNLRTMTRLVFDMPLAARCEVVFDLDVAYALISAAEDLAGAGRLEGRTGFVAGGRDKGCQLVVRDMLSGIFGEFGLPVPEASLFADDINAYYLDWYDSATIQSVLGFQRLSFEEWRGIIRRRYGPLRPLAMLFRRPIRAWLRGMSPGKGRG